MTQNLLVEAALFGYDTFADTADYPDSPQLPKLPTGNAVDRGWTPLDVGGATPGVDLGTLPPFPFGDGTVELTTAAHFYTGELEGKQTLVVAFRSTDEGDPEFAFQGAMVDEGPPPIFGWDLYFNEHADEVVQALGFAANPSNGIEQILITGHSLGGIVAELTTARLMGEGAPFEALAPITLLSTGGIPGSTETNDTVAQQNVVHTDDFVARLSDLSGMFQFFGAAREGIDITVERPEGSLPEFGPDDLLTPEQIFAAATNPEYKVEHDARVYIDTAQLLDSAEMAVPGVRDALDDSFRWLNHEVERIQVGGDGGVTMRGDARLDLMFTGDGDDRVFAFKGDDVLVGVDGDNWLFGGNGDDWFVDGTGNDRHFGGRGDDTIFVGDGNNRVYGGPGDDKVIVDGDIDDYRVTSLSFGRVRLKDADGDKTWLCNIETVEFDDQVFTIEDGELVPIEPVETSEDVLVAGDIA